MACRGRLANAGGKAGDGLNLGTGHGCRRFASQGLELAGVRAVGLVEVTGGHVSSHRNASVPACVAVVHDKRAAIAGGLVARGNAGRVRAVLEKRVVTVDECRVRAGLRLEPLHQPIQAVNIAQRVSQRGDVPVSINSHQRVKRILEVGVGRRGRGGNVEKAELDLRGRRVLREHRERRLVHLVGRVPVVRNVGKRGVGRDKI